jgi:hypothetical protein
MARGHGRPHFKDHVLAATSLAATLAKLWPKPGDGLLLPLVPWKFSGISSGQRFDSIQQVFLACDSGDLIAQLPVLEKE